MIVRNRLHKTLWALSGRSERREEAPGLSLRGVIAALRAAGFRNCTVHSLIPGYRDPAEIRPVRGVIGRLSPYYLVAADAGPDARWPLKEIMQCLHKPSSAQSDTPYRLRKLTVSAKEKSLGFVEAGKMTLVVRLPHTDAAREAEERAHAILAELAAARRLKGRIPAPLGCGVAGSQWYFAETCIAGVPLASELRDANRPYYAREVERWLRELNPLTDDTACASESLLRRAKPAIDRVLREVPNIALRERAARHLETALEGATVRTGVLHGDLSVSNIFVDRREIRGVVDWENAERDAPMILDAFNYLDSAQRHCHKEMSLADTIPRLADGDWPVPEEFEFLQEFFRFCEVDLRYRHGIAWLYFLNHVGAQLKYGYASEGPRQRAVQMLGQMVRR